MKRAISHARRDVAVKLRKLPYYARSSVVLARRLRRRRDFVAVVLDPSREVQFEDGLVLRVLDRLDLLVLKETLCDDVYGLEGLVAPGLIIDIGAGVGSFAVVAARRFPACRVLAFEPDPEQCTLLRENAAANGVDIETRCLAIGTKPTYLLSGEGARSSTVVRSEHGTSVPGAPLDDFLGGETVDLLKIDCEGAELDVLRSISEERLARVTRVALEYHNFHGETNETLLAALLADARFEVRLVPDRFTSEIGYIYAHRS